MKGELVDVVGVASGETAGNVFYFVYDLDLPVGDTTYEVNFEDWMYLLDKNTLLARSYMNKWGFDLGEVTIVMKKKGKKLNNLKELTLWYENLKEGTLDKMDFFYDENVFFKDPFNEIEGRDKLMKIFAHMFESFGKTTFCYSRYH